MPYPFKKSLILKIPAASVLLSVETWSSAGFFKHHEEYLKDPYNFSRMGEKIEKFIDAILITKGYLLDQKVKIFLKETIANAYDAHHSQAQLGHPLTLKIVVKSDPEQLSINIMDNGSGFLHQPKSVTFQRTAILEPKKDRNQYIGGMGIGLRHLEESVTASNGNLFFKNRKEKGATVSVKFPLEAMTTMNPQPQAQEMQENPDKDHRRYCTIL